MFSSSMIMPIKSHSYRDSISDDITGRALNIKWNRRPIWNLSRDTIIQIPPLEKQVLC